MSFLEEFNEGQYREILRLVVETYPTTDIQDFRKKGRVCLWRHDVDYSLRRSVALARIEAEFGIRATYFLNIHCDYYNLLGVSSVELGRTLVSLGHRIGLHFDPSFYKNSVPDIEKYKKVLIYEKGILETVFDVPVEAYSLHNPTLAPEWNLTDTYFAGMINLYSAEIQSNFTYVSDSNGFWQQRGGLHQILVNPPEKLQVLTHPEWWHPSSMSPRDRISKCIDDMAEALNRQYDDLLASSGRPNIGGDNYYLDNKRIESL